ncbi:Alpha-L-fucosidase, partial [Popillia japonica]
AHRLGKRTDVYMQNWREHGLGQFIHWGVYAIPGGHWNGKYYGGAAEWIRSWKEMPKEEYDNLYKQFNPKALQEGENIIETTVATKAGELKDSMVWSFDLSEVRGNEGNQTKERTNEHIGL